MRFKTLRKVEGITMRVRSNAPRTGSAVFSGRKAIAVGAIGLLTTLGMTLPSGAASVTHNSSSHVTLSSHAAAKTIKKVTHIAFSGSYTGTIALLWSSTGVQATSVVGKGTATDGADALTGTGSGVASSTCNPFSGTGSVSGPSGLKLSVVSSSATQACAVNSAAPTPVTVKGVAKIISGTGKFKGATGTLSFKGLFQIQSTTAGSNESDSFSATLTGTITITTVVAKK